MRIYALIVVFCVIALSAVAQKTVSVSGEYTYYAPSSMSLEQAKQEALLQTRLHVLAARFGTIINSTTNILIDNKESSSAESLTQVTTLATHEVKGEWIEDTRESQQEISYNRLLPNTTIILTRVWGKAREIVTARADLDVRLMKDTILGSETDVFRHEQNFYISLQSPVAGYVAIYLMDTDEDEVFCLLPAVIDSRGAIPIESNRRYVFFSEDYAKKHYGNNNKSLGTEYIFTTDKSVIFNNLCVVFSPNEFFKANDRQEETDRYVLPRQTTISEFNKWLAKCKTHDTQMVEKIISVKIVK